MNMNMKYYEGSGYYPSDVEEELMNKMTDSAREELERIAVCFLHEAKGISEDVRRSIVNALVGRGLDSIVALEVIRQGGDSIQGIGLLRSESSTLSLRLVVHYKSSYGFSDGTIEVEVNI